MRVPPARPSVAWVTCLLNYRYQAYFDESRDRVGSAIQPRAAHWDDQRGNGRRHARVSGQSPFSTTFGDKWFLHLNAGRRSAGCRLVGGRDLWHYNLGRQRHFRRHARCASDARGLGLGRTPRFNGQLHTILFP